MSQIEATLCLVSLVTICGSLFFCTVLLFMFLRLSRTVSRIERWCEQTSEYLVFDDEDDESERT